MGSIRTLVGIVVLLAIGYGVYVSINRSPKATTQPEVAPGWFASAPGDVIGAATPQFPTGPGGSGMPTNPGMVPGFPSGTSPVPATAAPSSNFPGITPNVPTVTPNVSAVPPNVPAVGIGVPGAPPSVAAPAPPASSPLPVQTPARNAPSPYPSPTPPEAPSKLGSQAVAPASNDAAASSAGSNRALPSDPLRRSFNPAGLGPQGVQPASNNAVDEFASFMQAVQAKLYEGRLDEAHLALSSFYNNPRLSPDEVRQLTGLLDQIAGTVIYSRQHLLEPPYKVQPGDTLERIGQQYNVPGELLAKINGIKDPQRLAPGQELKVVRGPFDAIIDLSRYELSLMLKGRYAGRFPIGVGRDQARLEGEFVVRDKKISPTYYGPDRVVEGNAPGNPLGKRYVDLGSQIGIHGTDDPASIGRFGGRGTISLGDRDVDDVFDILSIGSRVTIRR